MENDSKPGRKRPLILAGVAAVVALVLGSIVVLSPVSATNLASVRPLEPTVSVEQPSDRSPQPITSAVSADEGARIHTDKTGVAEISYFDGSITRLGPETDYQLTTLDDSDGRAIVGDLDVGRTFHRVAELSGTGDRFEIRTGTAVAAVRGTRFIVNCVSSTACTVSVIDGVVEVTNRISARHFTLRACQKGDALESFSDDEPLDQVNVRGLDPEDPWLLLNLGLEGIEIQELEEDCPDLFASEGDAGFDDEATLGDGTLTGSGATAGAPAFAGSRTVGTVPIGGSGTNGGAGTDGGTAGGGDGSAGTPTTQPGDEVLGEVVERPDETTTTTARPGRGTTTTTQPGQTTTTTSRPPGTTSTTRAPGTTSTTCPSGYPPQPC